MSEHDDEGPPPGTRFMAVLRWLIVLVMAAAAFGSLAYYFGWFQPGSSSESAAKDVYYCPMHPGVVNDHAGECPICNMTLVKKEKGPPPPVTAPAAAAAVVPGLVAIDLSPERIQLAGLRTARATRESLASDIHTVGFVTVNEKGLAQVQTRISGWIQGLAVARTGEQVKKGQVVASIYSPDLLAAQQDLLNALRWDHPREGNHGETGDLLGGLGGDARARLELLGVSREDVATIERTGRPLRELQIRAPASGVVTQKNAVEGLFVQPGTVLYELADLSTVWVLADVYEYELARVRPGQKTTIRFGAYPDRSFPGTITFLYPTLDPGTRTLRVRIELKNPDLDLRPGMYGNVRISSAATDGIFVPFEAVVDTGEAQYLFLAQESGRFEPRRVKLGARAGEKVQILEGIAEGDEVVTTANFLLDSESRLRATIEGERRSDR